MEPDAPLPGPTSAEPDTPEVSDSEPERQAADDELDGGQLEADEFDGDTPPTLGSLVPPVVAVLVTHDPGDWFDETLASLAAQNYPDLSVLVIDTASAVDPTPQILEVLPDARIERLDRDPGYSAAANLARDLAEGTAFHLFCHDDIALEPDTVRRLVEEAFRSNAGIVGPKLVSWQDPTRILQVGMSADKTGVLSPIAEPGELDQQQHDAVRDVFTVTGACTLVRADLFEALGGFDEGITSLGEDLDLCWRAHGLGARVIIAPAARVRHLEAMGVRRDVDDRRRRFARHRLRTSLIAYGPLHRVRVLPQALFFAVVEALYSLLAGHPQQARDVLAAWPWTMRRGADIRRRRKAHAAIRRVHDREVRALQVRGSARLTGFIRGQFGHREDRVQDFARSSRDLAGSVRSGSRQLTGTFAVLLGVLLVVSSRGLLTGDIPAIGEFARFPDSPMDLFRAWSSGWRDVGLGGPEAQPVGYGLLGLLGVLFGGAMGLARAVLILATIPIGAIGAWRLARPIGSARASVAAFAVYLAIPVPYNALARGSLSGLMVYALAPWLLLGLGRASGLAPFGPVGAGERDPGRPADRVLRSAPRLILGLGLWLAVVGAFAPFVIVITVVVVVALALGSLFSFRVAGTVRMVGIAVGALAVAMVLHLPWSFEVLTSESPWASVAGLESTTGGPLTLGRILRFETGPWGAPPLGFLFLLASALPIIIGRGWRLEWAVRVWFVALAGWGVLWAGQAGHLPVGLPAAEVLLAPVAAALAFAAALGLASFEVDLRAYRFGWRQIVSAVAALGVILGAAPLAGGILDGRWRMPTSDHSAQLGALLNAEDEPFRVLWLGSSRMLPAAGWRLDDDSAYATTSGGYPTVLDRFAGPAPGATPVLADALDLATSRRTNRLGQILAPMGVRYLVAPSRLAPSTTGDTGTAPLSRSLREMLAQQLDLVEVPVSEGLLVYRNSAWTSSRTLLVDAEVEPNELGDALAIDPESWVPVLSSGDGLASASASGEVPDAGHVHVAATADDGWNLHIDGVPMGRSAGFGWAVGFNASRAGHGELSYTTPFVRTATTVGQGALWLLAVLIHSRYRGRDQKRVDALTSGSGPGGEMSVEVPSGREPESGSAVLGADTAGSDIDDIDDIDDDELFVPREVPVEPDDDGSREPREEHGSPEDGTPTDDPSVTGPEADPDLEPPETTDPVRSGETPGPPPATEPIDGPEHRSES